MKIKKHAPKVLSGMLCFSFVFGSLFPASATDTIITETPLEATENRETKPADLENTWSDNGDIPKVDDSTEIYSVNNDIDVQSDETRYETIEVTYSQASNYLVTIPKTISLGADKQSSYPIKVEGDIAANKQVCIVPVDGIEETEVFDFYMSDQIAGSTKPDVVAEINQTKFYWNHEDVLNGYEETGNYIVADGLSAGRWKGTFQMEISMRTDPSHIHNYVGEITNEPTCTEAGEKTYTCDCGESYTETVEPTGHHYKDGECTDCGEKDPDHEHHYTETVTKEPTCTETGEKKLICSCGDTRTETIPATGHDFVDGKCTDCHEKDPDYHTHSYTEKITREPTCTEAGEKIYTCTCGDSYTESIPATGHHYGDDDKCTDCGELNPDHEHNYTEKVTKEPTCTEAGEKTLTCICGDTRTESIPATGHHYGDDDKCTDCGIFNPDHQHKYTEEVTKEPTCTEAGEKTLTCVCGDTRTESVPTTGHNFVDGFCSGCGASDGTVVQVDTTKTINYVAKSRGYTFRIVVPDKEITCTMTDNDQISLDGNTVTVAEDSTIGVITPVKVQCDGKTYTLNVITAPDISDNSYEIYNSNDLVALRTIVYYAAINDVNQNTKLMNDIDLSDVCSSALGNWGGIGVYHGIFDGQNYSINNLYISDTNNYGSASYTGLFSKTENATIKNTTLNGSITRSSTASYGVYVGGFCGYSTGTVFENLVNNCTIYGYYNATATAYASNYIYGGICGTGGTFTGCTNNGNITGVKYVGGICGTGGKATNCNNTGTIRGNSARNDTTGYIGGIVGSGTAKYCYNSGAVMSSRYSGGICGDGTTIEYCYNTGNVSASNGRAGGIAAQASSINNCFNTGNITSTGSASYSDRAGGIAGYYANRMENCYNTGTITGYQAAGGIVGEFGNSSTYIVNCYNNGAFKVTSTSGNNGGIVGLGSVRTQNCYSSTSRFYGKDGVALSVDCKVFDTAALSSYAEMLGDAYTDDTEGINGGYPILKFQVE